MGEILADRSRDRGSGDFIVLWPVSQFLACHQGLGKLGGGSFLVGHGGAGHLFAGVVFPGSHSAGGDRPHHLFPGSLV